MMHFMTLYFEKHETFQQNILEYTSEGNLN